MVFFPLASILLHYSSFEGSSIAGWRRTVRRANNKVIKRVSLPSGTAWNQSASRLSRRHRSAKFIFPAIIFAAIPAGLETNKTRARTRNDTVTSQTRRLLLNKVYRSLSRCEKPSPILDKMGIQSNVGNILTSRVRGFILRS